MRSRTVQEKIDACLDYKIRDLHPTFREMANVLLQSSDVNNNVVLSSMLVCAKFQIIAIGKFAKRYWISRGWSESESDYKANEAFQSIHIRRLSPFSKEYWINKGYSEEESHIKRNSLRPIRKEYWINKGYSEEESIELAAKRKSDNNSKGARASANRSKEMLRSSSKRCKEYWLLRGYSDQSAAAEIAQQQTTFSLETCVEKYGETDGILRWQKRQEQWLKSMESKGAEEKLRINRSKMASGYSISKAERYIAEQLNLTPYSQCCIDPSKGYVYDIVVGNKIIEYNGDYWHMNPSVYKEDAFNGRMKKFARDIWSKDKEKLDFAKSLGFEILVIWERDYEHNRQLVIDICKNFLKQ